MMAKLAFPRDLMAGWPVLVVDDDPGSLEVAEILLDYHGLRVYTATNGAEALRVAREIQPKFIISDISMPVMDGWTFIDQLQGDARLAGIPVIALTAHAMQGYRERALAKGFYNYLTKPLTVDTFMADLYALLLDIPALGLRAG